MKLNFFAYGARNGYGWLNGKTVPLAVREGFRKAIGKGPNFNFGESEISGVVNLEQEVLVYRFMRESSADSKGRDASYLAFTAFPRSLASDINAEEILFLPFFKTPVASPPDSFEYTGPSSSTSDLDLIFNKNATGLFSSGGSLAAACSMFSSPFPGTLRITCTKSSRGMGSVYRYQHPQSSEPIVPEQSIQDDPITPLEIVLPKPQPAINPPVKTVVVKRGCPWVWVIVIAVLLFLAGFFSKEFLSRSAKDTATNLPAHSLTPSQFRGKIPTPEEITASDDGNA